MRNDADSIWYRKLFSPNEGTPKRQQLRTSRNQNRNEKLTSLGIWFQTLDRVYGTLLKNDDFKDYTEEAQIVVFQGIIEDFWQLVKDHSHQDLFNEPYLYSIMTSKGVRVLHLALNDIIKALELEGDFPTKETMTPFVEDFDYLRVDSDWKNTKVEKGFLTTFGSANVAYDQFKDNTYLNTCFM